MGILMGIISWVIGLCLNLLDSCVTSFLGLFDFSLDTMRNHFSFLAKTEDIFTAMALTFLIMGLIWNIIKNLGVVIGYEAENPIHLILRVGIVWFAVVNATNILQLITSFFSIVLNHLEGIPATDGESLSGLFNKIAGGVIHDITGLKSIVFIILLLILGWRFIKFLVEVVERYVVYCFMFLIAPVFISTMAFKSTKQTGDTWLRAFFGQSLLIILNLWSCKMFISYLGSFIGYWDATSNDSMFLLFFIGIAFLSFASRIDSLLRILGLNTAHTGGDLVSGLGHTASRIAMVGHAVSRGVQRRGDREHRAEREKMQDNRYVETHPDTAYPGTAGGSNGAVDGGFAPTGDSGGSGGSGGGNSSGGGDSSGGSMNGGTGGTPDKDEHSNHNQNEAQQPYGAGRQMIAEGELQNLHSDTGANVDDASAPTTQDFSRPEDKEALVQNGMNASLGVQERLNEQATDGEFASPPMQDNMTVNAVHAAATSAEVDAEGKPVAAFDGNEAAATMNGVLGFGNDNVKSFHTDDAGGINGMNYKNGDYATFDSVSGGVGKGTYYNAETGQSIPMTLVHDNAVSRINDQMETGSRGAVPDVGKAGSTGSGTEASTAGTRIDTESAVGRIGDGSGSSGYYVYADNLDQSEELRAFLNNSMDVTEKSSTYDQNLIDKQRDNAKGDVPNI